MPRTIEKDKADEVPSEDLRLHLVAIGKAIWPDRQNIQFVTASNGETFTAALVGMDASGMRGLVSVRADHRMQACNKLILEVEGKMNDLLRAQPWRTG